jgi:RNA-dependent RNA polymerase
MNHSLREVKFNARIPVPRSYQLVGVADEGLAYIEEGANEEDVFTLGPGRIYGAFLRGSTTALSYANSNTQFVCKRRRMNHKVLQGRVISRSLVIHLGDGTYICMLAPTRVILISLAVQRVYALVGGPPEDKICFFRCLKNIVVLLAVGPCQRVSCMP